MKQKKYHWKHRVSLYIVDPNHNPKVFLDNFPMLANSVLSIHCIA